ncbi:MAG: hypothetical protein J6W14_04725 [Clostridia bacterium]|nr:hypothetical protein [Clostridia bacterium]
MFTDSKGIRRLKIGLHTHTTRSDGKKTPEEAAQFYKDAGYDAVALTDHWKYGEEQELAGLHILSGCEYNVGGSDARDAVYHIVGFAMARDPGLTTELRDDPTKTSAEKAKIIVDAIHAVGGCAVLAHPAWSLNTPEQCMAAGDFDVTEIFNSVSEHGMSDRPYSGLIIDMLAGNYGFCKPLLATDDSHYYAGEHCRGIVMVEAEAVEQMGLVEALRVGKFYATQGPEIHMERTEEGKIRLTCSPASKIAFFSNVVWVRDRIFRGEGLTEAVYVPHEQDCFVRAEVTDAEGNCAWSNIIRLDK